MSADLRVLTLDGGGIRGAFSVAFLAELEKEIGKPLYTFFDLIAGTSTGGIIALGLGLGEPCDRLLDFYRYVGPEIFKRRSPKKLKAPARFARSSFLIRHGVSIPLNTLGK